MRAELPEVLRTEVRQLVLLPVRRQVLDRVQFRSVAGKILQPHTSSLLPDKAPHCAAVMTGQVVLQHRRLAAWRPGAAAMPALAQSAFVDEDDRAALVFGLFLNSGRASASSVSCPTPSVHNNGKICGGGNVPRSARRLVTCISIEDRPSGSVLGGMFEAQLRRNLVHIALITVSAAHVRPDGRPLSRTPPRGFAGQEE